MSSRRRAFAPSPRERLVSSRGRGTMALACPTLLALDRIMRLLASLLAVAVVGPAFAQKPDAPVVAPLKGESKTVALFDGKTLAGWDGYEDLWSVKDGVIVAKNTAPLKFSTYLLTKDKYTDFRLTFSAKLVESEMHSGVAFWGKVKPDVSKDAEKDRTAHTYAGHLVMFPSGYGMYDLFGRNGLPVDGKPAMKVGSSTTGTRSRCWPRATASGWRSTAPPSWTGATRSPRRSRKPRSASNCTRTTSSKRSTSRA